MIIRKHFKIKELVSPQILAVLTEEAAWRLIPSGVLHGLDCLRDAHGYPITINGAGNTQCGVRAVSCTTGAPFSDHKLQHDGVCAFDLHSPQLRSLISLVKERHAEFGIYRIENPNKTPGWLHVTMTDHLPLPPFEVFDP